MASLKKGQLFPGYNLDKFVRTFGRRMRGRTPEAVKRIPEFSALKGSLSPLLKPNTTVQSFIRMHFKANGTDITGQTILRNVGLGKRNGENLLLIKSAAGCPSVDLSDPDNAMDVLASVPSGVDLKAIPFDRFNRLKIESDLYSGPASGFLTKALAPYTGIYVTRPRAFYYFILSTGIDRRDLTLEPEDLRKVLDSCGIDFNGREMHVKDFMRLKFTSPHVKLNRRNNGSIKGQSLLYRYGGHRGGCTTDALERLLVEAGYMRPLVSDLASPESVKAILASAERQQDWSRIVYNRFKYVRFDSFLFKGIGETWLRRTGDVTAKGLARLLKAAGHDWSPEYERHGGCHPTKENIDFSDPEQISAIFASAKEHAPWEIIKFREFERVQFDCGSPRFKAKGKALLKRFHGLSCAGMRRLLKIAGIENKPFIRFTSRQE